MTRRLVLGALAFTALILVMLEVPLGLRFAESEEYRLLVALERDAGVIADLVEDELERGAGVALDPPIGDYATRSGTRVIITDADGRVLHDSAGDAAGQDFSNRPEVAGALAGRRSGGRRASATLGQDLLFVAEPVASGGRVLGAVRITFTADELAARVRAHWFTLAGSASAVLVAAALAAVVVARWVSRPTRELTETIAAMAGGDLDVRAPTTTGPTELREVAARFNALTDRLAELIERQRRFAGDASHQLRSPLTALRLELEDLEAELVDAGRDAAAVRAAIDEADRLEAIIAGLLAVARAERVEGAPDDRTRPSAHCALGEVVTARVDAASAEATRRDVRLESRIEQDATGDVAADAGDVAQIVDNLLSNALRHAPTGSTVSVHVARDGDHLHCDVRDRGAGLSGPDRVRAFDRFWRAPDLTPETGSGLGLPIARALARRVGGEVLLLDVDDADGTGRGLVARLVLRVRHEAPAIGSTPNGAPAWASPDPRPVGSRRSPDA